MSTGQCPYGSRCRFIHEKLPEKGVLGTLTTQGHYVITEDWKPGGGKDPLCLRKNISGESGDIDVTWDDKKEESYLKQLKKFVQKLERHEADSVHENVNGVLITKKLLNKERKNICPVCGSSVKNINDDIYILKFDCCEKCYISYVEGREARWMKGWRPENVTKST